MLIGRIVRIPDDQLHRDRRAVVRRIIVPYAADELLDDGDNVIVIQIEIGQLQQLHLLTRRQILGVQEADLQIIAPTDIGAVEADGFGSHRSVEAHAEVRAPVAVIGKLQRCRLLGLGELVLRLQIRRLPGLRPGLDVENGNAGLRLQLQDARLRIRRRHKGVARGLHYIGRIRICRIPDDQLDLDRLADIVRRLIPHAAGELLDTVDKVIVRNLKAGKAQEINRLVLFQRVREQEADLILLAEAIVLSIQAKAACGNGAVKGDAIIGAPGAVVSQLLLRGLLRRELVFRLQDRGFAGGIPAHIIEGNVLLRLQRLNVGPRERRNLRLVFLLLEIEVPAPGVVPILLEIGRHLPGDVFVHNVVVVFPVGIPGPFVVDDLNHFALIAHLDRDARQHVLLIVCGVDDKFVPRRRSPVIHGADQIDSVLHLRRHVIGGRQSGSLFRRLHRLLRLCFRRCGRARAAIRIRGCGEGEEQREHHQEREQSLDVFHAVSPFPSLSIE